MNLNKETLAILQNFSTINTNLVIKPGKKFSTMSSTKDILAEYEGDDDFTKQVSVFNLNELLGVISAFNKPEIDLDDKFLTVKEGTQKVNYVYAEESLLTTPNKSIVMPKVEIQFSISSTDLAKMVKMANILSVEDLSFIGDGTKIIARVLDSKNPTGNSFDIDLETKTTKTFDAQFKIEKLKLFPGDYDVELTQRISRFAHKGVKLVVYVAVEASSKF